MTGNKNVSKNFTWALYPVKLLHVPLFTRHCVNMRPAQTKLVWETCVLIPKTWCGIHDILQYSRRVGMTFQPSSYGWAWQLIELIVILQWLNSALFYQIYYVNLMQSRCLPEKKRYLKDQTVDAELSFQNIFEKHEFFLQCFPWVNIFLCQEVVHE